MKSRNVVAAVILTLVAVAFLGISAVIQRNTIIEWWKPAAACLPAACALALLLRKAMPRVTRSDNSLVNFAAAAALSFSVILGSFYALNFYNSRPDTVTTQNALITGKYSEEHYRTKRISRNRTTRGEKYYVYGIIATLPDGKTKKIEVSVGQYAQLRRGQKLELKIEQGYFGVPVIKNLKFPARTSRRY